MGSAYSETKPQAEEVPQLEEEEEDKPEDEVKPSVSEPAIDWKNNPDVTHAEDAEDFINTPLEKYGLELPGLSTASKLKLRELGITQASQLLGQYLAFNRNRETFWEYFEKEVGLHWTAADREALVYVLQQKLEKLEEY